MTPDFDPQYVAARRVLLDALDALTPHRSAVIVAGAQAVYLHTGESDLGIAPYTTDGDLALDPTLLDDDPQLTAVMRNAGFTLLLPDPKADHVEPGIWTSTVTINGVEIVIPIDLIVPEALAGTGRRGALLGPHGNQAARRSRGLEAALVDHSTMTIPALEPADTRTIDVEVAGPAALLVAKAHKIHDRLTSARPDPTRPRDRQGRRRRLPPHADHLAG